ncbi:putative inner membrane protein [Shigella flexneri 1235-66]|nr:putative inner membrane protein [Shigella flexneri 1235-66]
MWVIKKSILRAIFSSGLDALNVSVSKNVGFYAVMAAIAAITTWFLSRDKNVFAF